MQNLYINQILLSNWTDISPKKDNKNTSSYHFCKILQFNLESLYTIAFSDLIR